MRGLAGSIMSCEYDTAKYPTGVVKPQVVVEGVTAYDPRQDSTYPGGSGPQRATDESTWAYSQNPYLHALTWIIGRTANGQKTMGLHAPLNAIDMPAFVNGANIADSHGWTLGACRLLDGRQARRADVYAEGGLRPSHPARREDLVPRRRAAGEPRHPDGRRRGGRRADRRDPARPLARPTPSGRATGRRRRAGTSSRPRRRSKSRAYFTHDGGQRSKEVEYTLCQSADQVATLARYDIENGREFGPITLPCKPRWMGYKPGDGDHGQRARVWAERPEVRDPEPQRRSRDADLHADAAL